MISARPTRPNAKTVVDSVMAQALLSGRRLRTKAQASVVPAGVAQWALPFQVARAAKVALEVPVQDLVERTEQMGELAEVAEVAEVEVLVEEEVKLKCLRSG
mmetsp:Transcript_4203/g.9794  ORF Transcript_4203/g.9794 Transcript_4203/m.9794 type:complete len:102 (-) Transcript_4203:599-904(-)